MFAYWFEIVNGEEDLAEQVQLDGFCANTKYEVRLTLRTIKSEI